MAKGDYLEKLKELEVSKNLVHRVVVAEEANDRQGTQSARTRSEAKGGGRKPYKQKKTGNARQGTIRAPHYAHGGMALAVKPRDYTKKVNKKERRLATAGALAARLNGGDVITIDKIALAAPKTKDAVALLKKHGLTDVKRVLIILGEHNEATYKSFRNLQNVEVRVAPNKEGQGSAFSTRDLIVAHKILMSKDAADKIEEAWSK